MSDRGSTSSNPPSLADQGVGTTQVIDLADIDLSGALEEHARKVAPPPLPPEEIARASQAPSAPPPPPQAPLSQAPVAAQPAPRTTRFYLIVLAACLVAFVAAGALIARSMRGTAAAAPAPAASGSPAARVITISPVEMTDDVDGGK